MPLNTVKKKIQLTVTYLQHIPNFLYLSLCLLLPLLPNSPLIVFRRSTTIFTLNVTNKTFYYQKSKCSFSSNTCFIFTFSLEKWEVHFVPQNINLKRNDNPIPCVTSCFCFEPMWQCSRWIQPSFWNQTTEIENIQPTTAYPHCVF